MILRRLRGKFMRTFLQGLSNIGKGRTITCPAALKDKNQRTGWLYAGLVLFIFFSFWFLPVLAQAAPETPKVVRVGYFEDNDGFQAGFSDNEPKSGYAYEYYQELAKYTGWTYQYIYGNWSDIYKKLIAGEVDIMAGVSQTPERLPYMLFPENIMGVELLIIPPPCRINILIPALSGRLFPTRNKTGLASTVN